MRTLIEGGKIVNEGKCFEGSIVIEDERIIEILNKGQHPEAPVDKTVDASGCFVLPGIIDTHVHFREPGMTEKADIESESRAAAAGGVTSYFEMPNTVPQTTTLEALEDKFQRAAKSSHVNYTFFFGATNDNVALFDQLDIHRIPGIKLFMGSSTGRNMEEAKKAWGDDPQVSLHALIRSEEACMASTTKAVELAKKHHARLHVAHLSTADELELIPVSRDNVATNKTKAADITAEVTVGHLYFSMLDHERITTIATDHAPHLLEQKQGGCAKAASGMPMVQFSLPTMLELVDAGILTIERMVQLMAHNPALLFEVHQRGFIRKGYQADLTIVRPKSPWTVTQDVIQSKCKWSPMEGHTYNWRVEKTFCNGHLVYNDGVVDQQYIGQPLAFR